MAMTSVLMLMMKVVLVIIRWTTNVLAISLVKIFVVTMVASYIRALIIMGMVMLIVVVRVMIVNLAISLISR